MAIVAVSIGVVSLISLFITIGVINSVIQQRNAAEARRLLELQVEQARQQAERDLADATNLWDAGDRVGAVTKYKAVIEHGDNFGKGQPIFSRVIDFETTQGNTSAARSYIEKAQSHKIVLSLTEPKAKAIAALSRDEWPVWQEQESLAMVQNKLLNALNDPDEDKVDPIV